MIEVDIGNIIFQIIEKKVGPLFTHRDINQFSPCIILLGYEKVAGTGENIITSIQSFNNISTVIVV
jgi:hypothetical protein